MSLVFSDDSGKQGIIEDITFLLAGTTIVDYPLADRTRNVNLRQSLVWHTIFEAYGGWLFMDDSQSDATTGVPYADTNLVNGTGLYVLPTSSIVISSAWMKATSGSTFNSLIPMTPEEYTQRGGESAFAATGIPTYYMLQGDIIRLLPAPNFTLSSALRVYFEKDFTAFTVADTTKTPGFAGPFHRALSIGAALDYALVYKKDLAANLASLWTDLMGIPDERIVGRIARFYAKRFKERFPSRIKAGEDLADEYR